MSLRIRLKLSVSRTIDYLIVEIKSNQKDFRLIDSEGNSILFHKIILQSISSKFDYLNKFCGDVVDGFEQMRLQSLNYVGLQSLYDLIYSGSLVVEERQAWDLVEQLQILQLPIISEAFDDFLNYNSEGNKMNIVYGNNQLDHHRFDQPALKQMNGPISLRSNMQQTYIRNDGKGDDNDDKVERGEKTTVHWVDMTGLEDNDGRRTELRRPNGVSPQRPKKIRGRKKRNIAHLHQMTVTSMTASCKTEGSLRPNEPETLTKNTNRCNSEKEQFLAEFGLYYSPRPVTRGLIKQLSATPYPLPKALLALKEIESKSPSSESISDNKIRSLRGKKKEDSITSKINKRPTKSVPPIKRQSKRIRHNLAKKEDFRKRQGSSSVHQKKDDSDDSDDASGYSSDRASCRERTYNQGQSKSPNEYGKNSSSESDSDSSMDTGQNGLKGRSEVAEASDESTGIGSDSNESYVDHDNYRSKTGDKRCNRNPNKKGTEKKLQRARRMVRAREKITDAIVNAFPSPERFKIPGGIECFVCGGIQSGNLMWKSHILAKHYSARFFCHACFFPYKTITGLDRHNCRGFNGFL